MQRLHLSQLLSASKRLISRLVTSVNVQAVFSRPVIALGSDFGIAEPPQSLVSTCSQLHPAFKPQAQPSIPVTAEPSAQMHSTQVLVRSATSRLCISPKGSSAWGQASLKVPLPLASHGLQVPFTVNCSVPGLFRWVTTNIARWDPTIEWPTDLDCSFEWNTALKSFDGV